MIVSLASHCFVVDGGGGEGKGGGMCLDKCRDPRQREKKLGLSGNKLIKTSD